MDEHPEGQVDLQAHSSAAAAQYEHVRPHYEALCSALKEVTWEALNRARVKVASIEARAKAIESFRRKASEPSDADPSLPKYHRPLQEITDLAGLRIITFFLDDLQTIETMIEDEFDILERSDKSELLLQNERFGYQSIHYVVKLKGNRTALAEYERYKGMAAEIQIRTILQHAWAEIEHDIQYRSTDTIPLSVRRRFMSLAGVLEVADREFQAIQSEDARLRQTARESVQSGNLEAVEITPDALKAYLDAKYGADDRISNWSYSWMASRLIRLGFTNFREVEECVGAYDDDKISRIVWGSRQGQVTRFDDALLAAIGELLIGQMDDDWYRNVLRQRLDKIRGAGIQGSASPPPALGHNQSNDR